MSHPVTTPSGKAALHAAASPHRIELAVEPMLVYDPKTRKFNREAIQKLSMATHQPSLTKLQQRESIQSILHGTSLDHILPDISIESVWRLDEEEKVEEAHSGKGAGKGQKKEHVSATTQLLQQWKKMKSAAFLTNMLMSHLTTLNTRHKLTSDEAMVVADRARTTLFPIPLVVKEILEFVEPLVVPSTFQGTKAQFQAQAVRALLQPFFDKQEELVCTVMEEGGRPITIRPRMVTAEERQVEKLLRQGHHSSHQAAVVTRNLARVRTTGFSRRPRRTPLSQLVQEHRKTAEAKSREKPTEKQEEKLLKLIRTTHVMNKPRTAEEISRDRNRAARRGRGGNFNLIYRKAILLDLMDKLQKEIKNKTLEDLVESFASAALWDPSMCMNPLSKLAHPKGHSFSSGRRCKNCNVMRVVATSKAVKQLIHNVGTTKKEEAGKTAAGQHSDERALSDSTMFLVTPKTLRVIFLMWLTREYDIETLGADDELLLQVFFDGPDNSLNPTVWGCVTHALEHHPWTMVRTRPKINGRTTFRHIVIGAQSSILEDLHAVLQLNEKQTAVEGETVGAVASAASDHGLMARKAKAKKKNATMATAAAATDRILLLAPSDELAASRRVRSASIESDSHLQAQRLRANVDSLVSAIMKDASTSARSSSPPAIIHRSTSVVRVSDSDFSPLRGQKKRKA